MIDAKLFCKAVEDSGKTVQQISKESGVPEKVINELMEGKDDGISVVGIQVLSRVLGMSENMRRNTYCNRNLPLE